MKKIILVFLVALGVAAYVGWKFFQTGLTIEITQQQLQAQLTQKFPIEKNYLVASLVLSDPQVILKNNSDRVFIGTKVVVSVPIQPKATGSTMLSGKLIYDPDQGAFLLTELQVEDLQIQGISGQVLDKTKGILGEIGAQVLNRFPVYRLDAGERTQKLAKSFLKSVDVTGGKLRVTLGI